MQSEVLPNSTSQSSVQPCQRVAVAGRSSAGAVDDGAIAARARRRDDQGDRSCGPHGVGQERRAARHSGRRPAVLRDRRPQQGQAVRATCGNRRRSRKIRSGHLEPISGESPGGENVPKVGALASSDFSVEKAIALNADLVVLSLGFYRQGEGDRHSRQSREGWHSHDLHRLPRAPDPEHRAEHDASRPRLRPPGHRRKPLSITTCSRCAASTT